MHACMCVYTFPAGLPACVCMSDFLCVRTCMAVCARVCYGVRDCERMCVCVHWSCVRGYVCGCHIPCFPMCCVHVCVCRAACVCASACGV